MSTWRILELGAMTVTFASMVWGMLVFFVPPTRSVLRVLLVAAAATLGYVSQTVSVWQASGGRGRAAVAIALYAVSVTLFWAAVTACRERRLTAIFEPDTPLFLIERGPYRYVRHPFYLSYAICWCSGAVSTGAWWTAVLAVVMTLTYIRAARREEDKFADSPFAARYRDYTSTTGFFWPRLASRRRQRNADTNAPIGHVVSQF